MSTGFEFGRNEPALLGLINLEPRVPAKCSCRPCQRGWQIRSTARATALRIAARCLGASGSINSPSGFAAVQAEEGAITSVSRKAGVKPLLIHPSR